jgi:hypothetical protein
MFQILYKDVQKAKQMKQVTPLEIIVAEIQSDLLIVAHHLSFKKGFLTTIVLLLLQN